MSACKNTGTMGPLRQELVGRFRLMEAYVKLNFPKGVVLVIDHEDHVEWLQRLGPLHSSPIRNFAHRYAVDRDTDGEIAVILCDSQKEAGELAISVPESIDLYIFVNGKCVRGASDDERIAKR